ncbi:hypothetical protein HID58_002183 [Brassica napus]|uniref:ATPase AAA-type core domain-containing protein n=1 Tax=Brassica napus TaxID=3708 RepID=A0ABQ8EPH4_BRANA|nr:hypothetical protein HID58_002183 [Brassica napus]
MERPFEQSNSKASDFFGALFSVGVAYADPDEVLSHTTSVYNLILMQANGKSSVLTNPPPNYADIARKEGTRIQEPIQSKGSQYCSCPRFNVSIRGQKITLKFKVPSSCEQTLDHTGGSDMILRSWDKQVLDGYNKAETLLLSCYPSPVAWQITLRSAEKKKEPGASEDESDEDLCILIFGSLLHSDKVEVEFIKKESLTTEELEAFVSALQVAGQNVDEIRQVEVEREINLKQTDPDLCCLRAHQELERHLVRVIANQADIPLLYVPLEAVMSKYYGESERLLGAVFSQANEISDGAIIFLDEIAAFSISHDSEMHEEKHRVLYVLLRQIDGFEQDKKVVVIAATNRKQDLDPALISRFESMIMVGLANPSRNHRPVCKTTLKA